MPGGWCYYRNGLEFSAGVVCWWHVHYMSTVQCPTAMDGQSREIVVEPLLPLVFYKV